MIVSRWMVAACTAGLLVVRLRRRPAGPEADGLAPGGVDEGAARGAGTPGGGVRDVP